jgi:hypothetical protein
MRVRTTRGSGQIGYRMARRRHDFGHPHDAGPSLRTLVVGLLAAAACIACIAFPPATTVAPPEVPALTLSLP